MSKQLSAVKKNNILMLHEQGMSDKDIASSVGCVLLTVQCLFNPAAKEKRAECALKYYRDNREKQLAYVTTYRKSKAGKEKIRQYRIDNKEIIKKKKQKYNKEHSSEISEHRRIYNKENAEHSAAYRSSHLPEYAAHSAARRALKIGTMIGATANEIFGIKELYRRAKESEEIRCYICGEFIEKEHRHIDHIIPLSKGGPHRLSNLAIACDTCNMRKGSKMPEKAGGA